ncbi:hypothetical protein B0T25DRAFT_529325 [Lasiosphaeria hispida]|uniref:Uncharacterized protein n=1 Tax=Lasiosphaeria hispida TaxID=260671 RepID=A0AAJ0MKS5_9PEZI|nr:hypothetical protein B0T25DRAFT_529325 [Lasiosphaeria hispida]
MIRTMSDDQIVQGDGMIKQGITHDAFAVASQLKKRVVACRWSHPNHHRAPCSNQGQDHQVQCTRASQQGRYLRRCNEELMNKQQGFHKDRIPLSFTKVQLIIFLRSVSKKDCRASSPSEGSALFHLFYGRLCTRYNVPLIRPNHPSVPKIL